MNPILKPRFLASLACAAVWCACPIFQFPTYTPPFVPTFDGGVPEQYEHCDRPFQGTLEEVLGTSTLRGVMDAVAQGALDIPLTADGCVRLEFTTTPDGGSERTVVSYQVATVEVQGYRLLQLLRTRLFRVVELSPTVWRAETDVRDWDLDAEFVSPDGFPETSVEFTVHADGGWAGDESVDYTPRGAPRRRWLRSPSTTPGTVAVRQEVHGDGGWALEDEFEVEGVQPRCVTTPRDPPPGGPCMEVPCSQRVKDRIRKEMFEALTQGYGCEVPWQHTAAAWDEIAVDLVEPVCIKGSGCPMAQVDTTTVTRWDRDPSRTVKRTMAVNVNQLGSKSLRATLFHELLHVGLGAKGNHKDRLLDLAAQRGKLGLVDQVYACERFCFSDDANCCDCATCFGKKACDCSTRNGVPLHKCPEPEPDTPAQTGALCPRSNVGAFCDTMAECNAACAGTTCLNFSRACGNCN